MNDCLEGASWLLILSSFRIDISCPKKFIELLFLVSSWMLGKSGFFSGRDLDNLFGLFIDGVGGLV